MEKNIVMLVIFGILLLIAYLHYVNWKVGKQVENLSPLLLTLIFDNKWITFNRIFNHFEGEYEKHVIAICLDELERKRLIECMASFPHADRHTADIAYNLTDDGALMVGRINPPPSAPVTAR